MSRIRYLSFILIACLLTACIPATPTVIPTPAIDREKMEEQGVFAAALKALFGASNYAIMDTSATGIGDGENLQTTIDFVLENMHDVNQDTVDNFIFRNDPASAISSTLELNADYILVSDYAYRQIFGQNQSGWEIFYNHYPNTPGLTTLSHAGFNPSFDQALVYVGTQSNWLAGAGFYLLMIKVDGTWTMDQQVMVWIS
jgi:hypothetical protein